MKGESEAIKRKWNKPTFQILSVKRTKGGGEALDPETATYSPGS